MHTRHNLKGWIVTILVSLSSPVYSQHSGLIEYRNAKWWDGRSEFSGSRFVREGQFVDPNDGAADVVIDLHGSVVTAPFGEGHNHNLLDVFFDRSNSEYLQSGVFYVKVPGIHPPAVASIETSLDRADTVDATYSMGSITSPGGHPVPLFVETLAEPVYGGATYEDFAGQAFHEVSSEADISSTIQRLIGQDTDFVKVILAYSEEFEDGFQDGMNPALLPFLVREAHAHDLDVTLHVDSAEDFRTGIDAGVDEIAHLPGLAWGRTRTAEQHRLTEEDAQRAAQAGIPVVATTHFQNVLAEMFSISADRVAAFKEVQRHNLDLLINAGVEIRIGSDVYDRLGNGLGANPTRGEVESLIALGVFDTTSALRRWIDTGRKIFPDRPIGCFEPGCEASFLVFDDDPREDIANLDRIRLAIKQGIDVTQAQ